VKLHEDEESWLTWVTDYAVRVCRPAWRIYHTRMSKGSHAGFPDLVLVRPPRLVFVELKTETGKLTRAQEDWMDDLAMCGAWHNRPPPGHLGTVIETYIWRPSARDEIQRLLA
jgi:hypothetical protein